MDFQEARRQIEGAGSRRLLLSIGIAMRQYTNTPFLETDLKAYALPNNTVVEIRGERDVRFDEGYGLSSIRVGKKGRGRSKLIWYDESTSVRKLDLRDFGRAR